MKCILSCLYRKTLQHIIACHSCNDIVKDSELNMCYVYWVIMLKIDSGTKLIWCTHGMFFWLTMTQMWFFGCRVICEDINPLTWWGNIVDWHGRHLNIIFHDISSQIPDLCTFSHFVKVTSWPCVSDNREQFMYIIFYCQLQ